MNIFKHALISQFLLIFILAIPIFIKLLLHSKIYGKYARDNTRLPGTGTLQGYGHLIQGILFGICIRFSNIHPIFLVLSYIFGTVYPIYNLSKRIIKGGKNFRDSSFYINLSDFVIGFIISFGSLEIYNLFTKKLDNIKINMNILYYYIVLYLILTIISLYFTFKK